MKLMNAQNKMRPCTKSATSTARRDSPLLQSKHLRHALQLVLAAGVRLPNSAHLARVSTLVANGPVNKIEPLQRRSTEGSHVVMHKMPTQHITLPAQPTRQRFYLRMRRQHGCGEPRADAIPPNWRSASTRPNTIKKTPPLRFGTRGQKATGEAKRSGGGGRSDRNETMKATHKREKRDVPPIGPDKKCIETLTRQQDSLLSSWMCLHSEKIASGWRKITLLN